MNRLMFGDNLSWLRNHDAFPNESVDLVYLDPPFNSNVDYNVLFREQSGEASRAQFHAFTDTWDWVDAEDTYREFIQTCPLVDVVNILEAFKAALKNSPMMAYLAMMTPRLVELHRVLKPTGSLYLHCDPTANHYLKMLLDAIFGPTQFQNEIVWKRTTTHSDSKTWSRVADTILFYTKTDHFTWNIPREKYSDDYIASKYRSHDGDGRLYMLDNMTSPNPRPNMMYVWKGFPFPPKGWRYSKDTMAQLDHEGRIWYPKHPDGTLDTSKRPRLKRYLDEMEGGVIGTVWTDIAPINSQAIERLGYPTQKPQALLERIIQASSNEGDSLLDPFGGCGTTVAAAQRLNRQWTCIDITYLAINLIKRRLDNAFGKGAVSFQEMGQPVDLSGATRLAEIDRFQFQQWALSLIDALPLKAGAGKGADRGVDGLLYFYEAKDVRKKILVQVKSGAVKRGDVATLLGDVDNQNAIAGILITLDPPTQPMRKEVVDAGRYKSALWKKKDYPKIQILTLDHLLNGARPDTPPLEDPFAKAPKAEATGQIELPRQN